MSTTTTSGTSSSSTRRCRTGRPCRSFRPWRAAEAGPRAKGVSMALVSSVLDLIGDTPLVDVSALSPNPGARILIKLEGHNPGGSIKDRIALSMVEDAEKDGRLLPGATLLEPSSGNTGIGLALVARVKGYHLNV